VLDADPDLGRGLSTCEHETARAQSLAALRTIAAGRWRPDEELHDADGAGLLVLDGVLRRRVVVANRVSCELLGAGDLLRPWDDLQDGAVPASVTWMLPAPVPVAILDAAVTRRLAAWPTIVSELAAREARRSHALAKRMAIAQVPSIELRVQLLFWHLADRWGRVTTDGVTLDLAPDQETIGNLIGASRGRVNTSLRALLRDGELQPLPTGWLLRGERPQRLLHDRALAAASAY
jgi:hypothetical protein